MRQGIEAMPSPMIEVDPCRQSSRSAGLNDDVLSIDFKASHGSSGVDV